MNWWKQFKAKSCSIKLKGADKGEVLLSAVQQLLKSGALDESLAARADKALAERELLASTGVGMNVAIPHVKIAGLTQSICSLMVLDQPVEWAAIDGEPVTTLFVILRPDRAGDDYDPEAHLEMMRWIAKLSRHPDFRRFAESAKTKSDLVSLLKEMSAV
ncbi:MAG: mannitol/fructose-specific phosphotransferase system IIA component (Ntr-type) [Chlamydiales bacterium]|jgi:mannitol/fructose-specific phosphotransferase system IIA component (Ntr-type)